MEDKNNFIDLPQQKRGSRQQTTRKVIMYITRSLIAVMLLSIVMACICGLCGGEITLFGGIRYTARGFIMYAIGVGVASMVSYFGGFPIIRKHGNTKTK